LTWQFLIGFQIFASYTHLARLVWLNLLTDLVPLYFGLKLEIIEYGILVEANVLKSATDVEVVKSITGKIIDHINQT
jgi:hypothetical protein